MIQQSYYKAQGIMFEEWHNFVNFDRENKHHISRDQKVLIQFTKKYVQVFSFEESKPTIKSYPKDPLMSAHNFMEMPLNPNIKERRYLTPYKELSYKKNLTFLYACYN